MGLFLSVGQVAKSIGARPQDVTNGFYWGDLDSERCPLMGGRRMIPEEYVPEIIRILRRRGKLAPETKGAAS